MTQLPPRMTVALGNNETPASLCSRNALLVGRTARDFCKDAGFAFQDIVDGVSPSLDRLAYRCRADSSALRAAATVKVSGRDYAIGDQVLTRESLCRAAVRVCPHCLALDIETGRGPNSTRPFGRLNWLIEPLRTCPEHGVGLVIIADDRRPARLHDFAWHVQPALSDLSRWVGEAPRRLPSLLQNYLSNRLGGKNQHEASFLNALPFYAAAKTCEVLGAVAISGKRISMNSLTDAEWHDAGSAGYEIAAIGEKGVRGLLTNLQEQAGPLKGEWSLQSLFGRVYRWLRLQMGDPAYDPVQEIFRQHAVETLPFGPGDVIFGREVTIRRLHSVRSAGRETGAHTGRLRKLLHAAGHISTDQLALTDEAIFFDANAARDLLGLISEEMSLQEAGKYLNVPHHTERQLFEAGHLRPFMVGGIDRSFNHAFAKRDLDLFLESLMKDAVEIKPGEKGFLPISGAATRGACTAVQIVDFILSGKLKRIRFRPDISGFSAIFVDQREICSLLDKTNSGILSLKEVTEKLKTDYKVVVNLVDSGIIPTKTVINSTTHWKQRVVSIEDLDYFSLRFASLHALARESGVSFRKMEDKFREKGIEPALDRQKVQAKFYERTVVAQCIAEFAK